MEKFSYKILYNDNAEHYHVNVFISQTYKVMGYYDVIEEETPSTVTETYTGSIISGETESRLNEVKTYDKQTPYKVNVNGVTFIKLDNNNEYEQINYTLDGINYITNLKENVTYYVITNQNVKIYNNYLLVKKNNSFALIEQTKFESEIFVDREEMSVLDAHFRLSNMDFVNDVDDYAGGFFFSQED